jgi:hypothetical protein
LVLTIPVAQKVVIVGRDHDVVVDVRGQSAAAAAALGLIHAGAVIEELGEPRGKRIDFRGVGIRITLGRTWWR